MISFKEFLMEDAQNNFEKAKGVAVACYKQLHPKEKIPDSINKAQNNTELMDAINSWSTNDGENKAKYRSSYNKVKNALNNDSDNNKETNSNLTNDSDQEKTSKQETDSDSELEDTSKNTSETKNDLNKEIEQEVENAVKYLESPEKEKEFERLYKEKLNQKKQKEKFIQREKDKIESVIKFTEVFSELLKSIFGDKVDTSNLTNAGSRRKESIEDEVNFKDGMDTLSSIYVSNIETAELQKRGLLSNIENQRKSRLESLKNGHNPQIDKLKEEYPTKISAVKTKQTNVIKGRIKELQDAGNAEDAEKLQSSLEQYQELAKRDRTLMTDGDKKKLDELESELGYVEAIKSESEKINAEIKELEKTNDDYKKKEKEKIEKDYEANKEIVEKQYSDRIEDLKYAKSKFEKDKKFWIKKMKNGGKNNFTSAEIDAFIRFSEESSKNLQNVTAVSQDEMDQIYNAGEKKKTLTDLKSQLEKYDDVPQDIADSNDPEQIKQWLKEKEKTSQNESYCEWKRRKKLYEQKLDKKYKKHLKSIL